MLQTLLTIQDHFLGCSNFYKNVSFRYLFKPPCPDRMEWDRKLWATPSPLCGSTINQSQEGDHQERTGQLLDRSAAGRISWTVTRAFLRHKAVRMIQHVFIRGNIKSSFYCNKKSTSCSNPVPPNRTHTHSAQYLSAANIQTLTPPHDMFPQLQSPATDREPCKAWKWLSSENPFHEAFCCSLPMWRLHEAWRTVATETCYPLTALTTLYGTVDVVTNHFHFVIIRLTADCGILGNSLEWYPVMVTNMAAAFLLQTTHMWTCGGWKRPWLML